MLHRFPLGVFSLAAITLLGGTARAQTQPASGDDGSKVQTLPVVNVKASADASAEGLKPPYAGGQVARGGRVGVLGSQDVMDTPFSITNYTQKLIQDQQAASIGDVLLNDPAVRVARGFGNYQQTYIVRGLPVFSDDMAYNGLYGLLPRQYLAAELVERVEVLRGASAFLNGAAPGGSGLGGAINVMPKRAPNEPLNEITLGIESGGQGYAAADFARRFGPDQSTGVRLNLVRRDGGTAVDDAKRELSLASVGFDFHTGSLRVSADIGYQDHKLKQTQPSITIGAGLAVPPPPDASKNVAQPWTFSNERDTFGTLRAEYDVAPDWTVWGAYGMRNGDESTDLANPTVTDAAGTLSSFRFAGTRNDRISTGEVGLRGKFQTAGVGHQLIVSAATYHAKTEAPFGFSDFGPAFLGTITSNLYAPVASTPPSAAFFTGETDSDTKTSSVSVSDTVSLLQDTLLITLGARHQRIQDGDYDKSRITPVAGVVFKLSKAVSVYGSYVEGLVKGDTAPATAGALAVTNFGEVFSPYQTKQTEIGVKVDTGLLGGSLSVFDARKPIYSVRQLTTTTGVFEQTDRQHNRGVELSFFGVAMPGLRVLGGGSYLDAKVGDANAIGAPKLSLNVGTEWDVPGVPGLAVNGRAIHTGAVYADAANTQQVPSWTRFDLGARYAFDVGAQTITIRARVDNVANRNYWASAGGFPGAGYLVLGEPRTFALSGTLTF